jgi:hypothetical protein
MHRKGWKCSWDSDWVCSKSESRRREPQQGWAPNMTPKQKERSPSCSISRLSILRHFGEDVSRTRTSSLLCASPASDRKNGGQNETPPRVKPERILPPPSCVHFQAESPLLFFSFPAADSQSSNPAVCAFLPFVLIHLRWQTMTVVESFGPFLHSHECNISLVGALFCGIGLVLFS